MSEKTLSAKVLHVAKTSAQWASETTVISKGMLCIEFATDGKTLLKAGDGVNTFADLPYITDELDMSAYYTKMETDSAISAAISAIGTPITVKGVKASYSELPASGNTSGDLWFVSESGADSNDLYNEYIWVVPDDETGRWEFIGKACAEIDLSGYAALDYVDAEIDDLRDEISDEYISQNDFLIINCSL